MVLDLATEEVTVTQLKSRDQMVAYTSGIGKDLPNLSKRTGHMRPVEELPASDPKPQPKPKSKPKPKPPIQKALIPRRLLPHRLKS